MRMFDELNEACGLNLVKIQPKKKKEDGMNAYIFVVSDEISDEQISNLRKKLHSVVRRLNIRMVAEYMYEKDYKEE